MNAPKSTKSMTSEMFFHLILKFLASREAVPVGLVSVYLLHRCHFYRHVRKFVLPLGASVIFIRAFARQEESILLLLHKWLLSFQNRSIGFALGDMCGIFACVGLFQAIDTMYGLQFSIDSAFELIKFLPFIQATVEKEKVKMEKDFEHELKTKTRCIEEPLARLPEKGRTADEVLSLMNSLVLKEDIVWREGKVSGAVYHGIKGHQALLNSAFGLYSISNPLHPDIWPSGMKFESEIIAMTAELLGGGAAGDQGVCGCTSSGGTESIILAIKAHRDFYREQFGITQPEMVCCTSAHAAVDKACDLMRIKLIKVPMDPVTFKVQLPALRRAIGPNTIMLYASAPSYPQGVVDPVREMAELALRYSIGLHVDCCLGGFVLPFARKLGYRLPDFDFSVPGVTSISADTHKYGYALKGTSVVLYRNRALRQAQYFCYSDWTGGLYTTPTIAGSRSGGLIAQCWASMVALGREGYEQHVREIMETTRKIAAGVAAIPGLKVLGAAEAMIVCFSSDEPGINIYSVAGKMSQRNNWALSSHQLPACVHLCVTVCHKDVADLFLDDLRACTDEVRSSPDKLVGGSAAIYGMTSSLPAGPVKECLKVYNDVVFKL